MNLTSLLVRRPRGPALHGLTTLRLDDVGPPPRAAALWQRLTDWLTGDAWAPTQAADTPTRLVPAREAYADTLLDIATAQAGLLQSRILAANSLDELWHLRPAIFGLVSRQHSQAEATRRVAALARHAPARSPSSHFAPL